MNHLAKAQRDIPKEIILYGGTGQAKVVRPIIEYYGSKVIAVFDDTENLNQPFENIDLFTGYESLLKWKETINVNEIGFVITIGNPNGNFRLDLHEKLIKEGLKPVTIIHPEAIIADNCEIRAGSQIMAGAVIMPEAKIGRQCIINTNASIDHECIIDDGCEVAPGATLCGDVKMHRNSWVCAGATVLPRISIGENSIVGAGSVVINDIEENKTVVGVPAKIYL
jgi:sugar O-acyltransferase (sialic acid O-acetyltransferase NeuD family)